MNIGFVSTWFERGAAYVTKNYIDLLEENHKIYIYARGGEIKGKESNWDAENVTWGYDLPGMLINFKHFKKWIKKNNIETIFFNEQQQMDIVYQIKNAFPEIKIGSYIDYYKENTVKEFWLYDFLICNTKRHYSVFKDHPQCYYVPWGTDVDLFKPKKNHSDKVTFYHSAGMSNRKGTSYAIDSFINGGIYKKANLIVHTQRDIRDIFNYNTQKLEQYNIKIIEKTVPAPGLYYMADVYLYPTMLDGLGLTMYEALASGLPVITTDHPPMNEVINKDVGYLVKVDHLRTRADAYYWPLSIVDCESLIEGMRFFINNPNKLKMMQSEARRQAIEKWNWIDRKNEIRDIFETTEVIVLEPNKVLLNQKSNLQKIKRKLGSSYLFNIYNKYI